MFISLGLVGAEAMPTDFGNLGYHLRKKNEYCLVV
jgi:hypothetical protein